MTTEDWIKLASYVTEIIKPLSWTIIIVFISLKFEKQIKELLSKISKFSGYGIEVVTEREKEWSKDRAESIINKSGKEIDHDEVQKLIQKSIDEAFVWGLTVAGYKPFNEIKDVEISKEDDGKGVRKEHITWKEN